MVTLLSGCYIEQSDAGWWNMLIVVMAALLVVAVWAGWTWREMAEDDARAVAVES